MRKKIQKKIDALLSFVIIVILLPLLVAIIGQRMQLEEIIYGGAENIEESGTEELEKQLPALVAKEIRVDANREAILAQCVIARTNLYDAKARQVEEPETFRIEELQELWGENFAEYYGYLEECVAQTEGEVLLYQGEYIYAAYHAISAGSTRDMSELYSEAKMPYLKVQSCEKDAVAEGYLSVSYMEKQAFVEECNRLFPEGGVENVEDVQIESRDLAGYVTAIKVGKLSLDGEEFREAFGLNSACLAITEVDESVRIVTKGQGHGFGLSQNTANEMAEAGSSYQEILTYFFPGTERGNVSEGK